MPRAAAEESPLAKDPLWQAFQKALDEGLPQTALERLAPIAERARTRGDVPEKIRVLATQISLEASTTDQPADAHLKKLRVAIDAAEPAMQPVLEAIQASWMWSFFQQHRWQFSARTSVAPPASPTGETVPVPGPEDDLLTWDLARILQAVDDQFARSLRAAETLKQATLEDYAKLLHRGNVPASYRPTMYDVLVHHALEFYSAGEQAGSRSIHAFDLLADSPVFSSVDEFLAWQPQSTELRAPLLVAVRLFQDLLRFHRDNPDPTALLDADLLRLEFANNHAVGEDKNDRYRAALKRFIAEHAAHPISAQAQANLAQLLIDGGDSLAAHRLASQAVERFPDSVGGKRCYNLIQQIEAREAQVSTERVWNAPWPTIDVHYRNVTKVYLRLVRFDFNEFVKSQRWQPEALDEAQQRALINAPPVRSWAADLPPTTDFRTTTHALPIPDDLPTGAYFLLASHREDFNNADNQVSLCEVWVSNLALVTRTNHTDGTIAGHVLQARTGHPLSGVKVHAWQWDRGGRQRVSLSEVRTDQNGEFQFPAQPHQQLLLLADHDGDRLSSAGMLQSSLQDRQPRQVQRTQFFTDRAIYRPGQTIRFKGICFAFDQQHDSYQTLARQKLIVALLDANGQEVERLEQRGNDYGSFSGSFTAPRGRLTGSMTIQVIEGPPGQGHVRVEEYKRPKFEVELSAPDQAAKLGQSVELTGKATAYTGATIGGASVQWRVVREVRFPPWWYWRRWWLPPTRGESQEIARGTAQTDDDGKFEFQFVARPDLSVAADSEPTFQFTVHADVTDGTGETRSAQRSVSAGYTALSANLTAAEWQTSDKPVELSISTSSLDGVGQSAGGTLKIHALVQPERVTRPSLGPPGRGPIVPFRPDQPPTDASHPNSWALGEVIFESAFETDGAGRQQLTTELPAGIYRAVLATRDRFGKEVKAELPLEVLDLQAPRWEVKLPQRLVLEQSSIEPGETLRAVWASGYANARVLIEVEHRGQMIQRRWTDGERTQAVIELPITEAMRGGLTLHTTFVHENRTYLESRRIDVPWSNKVLDIRWERFVSKLGPGQRETWTAIIEGSDSQRAAAEMVATLYDASLDQFAPHHWMSGFGVFRHEYSQLRREFANQPKSLQIIRHGWSANFRNIDWRYPTLDFPAVGMGYRPVPMMAMDAVGGGRESMMRRSFGATPSAPAPMEESAMAEGAPMQKTALQAAGESADQGSDAQGPGAAAQPPVSLEGVPLRTNLNETAFFFPHVVAGDDGSIKLEFTMPEALTRWRFLGFAHDRNLRAGLLSDTVVTSKDLMVQPNPPRFVREGDVLEWTVKVTNLSPTRQTGQAALNFSDPLSGDSLDSQLDNSTQQQPFDIPAGGSQTLAWRIRVPDGLTVLTYRAKASSGRLADGEEGFVPVLTRRILVTESLPLPMRGHQVRRFDFQRLIDSADSPSIQHQSLTVQMTSNPAWYAVMSLPYLMEYPHQCSEQIFNRLYANSLARHIATSDPKIERVFEQWRGTEALDSPLTKNQELKAALLEESPWFRQAQSESQARRNVGILFDQNRLQDELARALAELAERQRDDGRWSWFPDGPPSDYITLYITTGFGRLRHLGVAIDTTVAIRSLAALDAWMDQQYRLVLESQKKTPPRPDAKDVHHLNHTIALYLYGRSFFVAEHPLAAEHQPALRFWLDQAQQHWLKLASLQSQAHLALALQRFGQRDVAGRIMASLKERSLSSEEMGRYWKTHEQSYWWFHAPIETQAALIEAFDEVARDPVMVEDCKVWLLKQKQTQDWKTTKATADAVYALLLRGTDLLASNQLVEVSLGGQVVTPSAVEAGTGYYRQQRPGSQVTADLGRIEVTKRDESVAWGSVHWQYFEDIDRVTAFTDTPLQLTKELYVKRLTDSGPQLQPVGGEQTAPLRVGEELVVRLVLRVDRDMEYVHLRDHRGSGTEPVNVLSGYRYQDGLGYYESTRDTASHFFIDYLRRGTYVFEYSTRIQLRGDYQTGMANIQCMYAPEFGSHSQSIRLEVVEGN